MGLYHPIDGDTNLKYKLLFLLTPSKKISKRKALALNRDRCCHLALCLQLILFHQNQSKCAFPLYFLNFRFLFFFSNSHSKVLSQLLPPFRVTTSLHWRAFDIISAPFQNKSKPLQLNLKPPQYGANVIKQSTTVIHCHLTVITSLKFFDTIQNPTENFT